MKTVLLLVDCQNDFLAAPGLQPPAQHLARRAAALLDGFRRRRMPVIHVWTTLRKEDDRRLPHWRRDGRWLCVAGTVGHRTPGGLAPRDDETIIHKTGFNCFTGGSLEETLRLLGCDTVVLAGLHLHACVRTAAAECLERGLQVHLADDAVASNDPVHAAASRRWLSDRCAVFETTAALLARLDGTASPALLHRSPRSTRDVLFQVPVSGAAEVANATATARAGSKTWRHTCWERRRLVLEKIAALLTDTAPSFATEMAIDIGKPLRHGREELHRAAKNVHDVSLRAGAWLQPRREAGGMVRSVPLGTIAIISAWNNPVAVPIGKIAPALAAGNTVVWKPAPAATRVAQKVLALLHSAGVPEDAVCLLPGDESSAARLASDVNIDAVTLTGAQRSGHALQEICASRAVPFQAELSGNNAAIVWDDAGLVHAASEITRGAFAFAGQRCTANRRAIVPARLCERFLAELMAAACRMPWGDPLEDATEIGPVISVEKRDALAASVEDARHADGVLRVEFTHGGHAAESWIQAGAYIRCAIVACERPDHPLVQEEMMGPVLVIQPADDFEHALALCNGVRHGLAASLFSDDPNLQRRFLEEAQAGIIKFNASTAGADATLPFGGWKASGIGPAEHGEADRLFYTRLQSVYGATGEVCPGSEESPHD